MRTFFRFTATAAAAIVLSVFAAGPAAAQVARTFVSGASADTATCVTDNGTGIDAANASNSLAGVMTDSHVDSNLTTGIVVANNRTLFTMKNSMAMDTNGLSNANNDVNNAGALHLLTATRSFS